MPLVDVLRAAISEIEQYERVVLNVQPGIVVVGQAVNDVVHLVAEIVENATTFSPEDTQVYVSGQPLSSGGVLLDITDNGVGISDQEMSHANWRLDNPPVVDVAVSRRMGLFVVGRLAARHGVRVRLRHAQVGGLTALIWLPDTVAAPEVAPPLGRLRRFEADDYGPVPSLSAPPQASGTGRRPPRPRASRGSRPCRRRVAVLHPGRRRWTGRGRLRRRPPENGWADEPSPTLPVRGRPNGSAAPANGSAEDGADETIPRIPAAPAGLGGPRSRAQQAARVRRAGAAAGAQDPPSPIGGQNVHGGDGPSAGGPGANGAQGDRRRGRFRPGDGSAARHPGSAAADLRLARVRLVPPQRQEPQHGPARSRGPGGPGSGRQAAPPSRRRGPRPPTKAGAPPRRSRCRRRETLPRRACPGGCRGLTSYPARSAAEAATPKPTHPPDRRMRPEPAWPASSEACARAAPPHPRPRSRRTDEP